MNSQIDVVTVGYQSSNVLRREIPKYVAVGRRHLNDDITVDCINRDDVIKRRSVQHKSKRKHKPRQPEMNNQIINRELSDDEDTGSVCSSASGSSGGTGHQQRSARKSRCHIHGQRRKQDAELTISDIATDKLTTVCCTCRPANNKRITPCCAVVRPEPEGGPQSGLFRSTVDEFERLIYGPNEPLFSDCELITDDVESLEVRTSGDKIRKNNGNNNTSNDSMDIIENIFSSAQMVNTNTFMKIAIIQNELKNIKSVSLRRAESDVTSLCRRAEVVKEGCAQSDHSLQSASQLLAETTAELKSCMNTSECDGRSSQPTRRRPSVLHLEATRSHVTSCGGVRRRMINTDADIENAANSLDVAEMRVTELEEELKTLVGSMSGSTSDKKEKAIRDVTLRLKEAEHCAMLAEQGLLASKREAATHAEGLLMNLKKYQHIGSPPSCSFSLADLLGC